MRFCAICTADIPSGEGHPAPLGRDNAIVIVCTACNNESPIAYDATRGYEIHEGVSTAEIRRAADRTMLALGAAPSMISNRDPGAVSGRLRDRTPGWLMIRVSTRNLGAREAYERFRKEPWFAELRYLGCTSGGARGNVHVFERPDPRVAAEQRRANVNPLAAIELYRVKP